MRTNSGIYAILNFLTGHFYIGQAGNLRTRWKKHFTALSRGKHHNRHLQSAWAKYGSAVFIFVILEFVGLGQLTVREQFFLDQLSPIYNIARDAKCSARGIPKSYQWCEQTAQRMRGSKLNQAIREKIGRANAKPFALISPTGELIYGVNLRKFCRDNNLNSGAMASALKAGRINHYKGWRLP